MATSELHEANDLLADTDIFVFFINARAEWKTDIHVITGATAMFELVCLQNWRL